MSKKKKTNEVTITSKNVFNGEITTSSFDEIETLRVSNINVDLKPDFLQPCEVTLRKLEFKGLITLQNIISLLNLCAGVSQLILNNVRLEKFGRHYGNFAELKVSELVFFEENKLTRDESHIIQYFNKRIQFSQLHSIIFDHKIATLVSTAETNVSTATTASSTASGSASPSPKPQPVNDISNSVTTTVLSNFLIKCGQKLKNLVVNRKMILFHDDMNRHEVKGIQVDKFVCDMNCGGFEQFLNLQKKLKFIACHNTEPLRPYAFEAIMVCIQRNRKSLTEIRLSHKYVFKTENENLGKGPNVVFHDCSIYETCSKLQSLRLILTNRSFANDFEVKPGSIVNTFSLPMTLQTLIVAVDIISDIEMNSMGSKFSQLVNLKYFVVQGNPKSPFLMRLAWVQDLLDLPQKIDLFEFHNCQFRSCESSSSSDFGLFHTKIVTDKDHYANVTFTLDVNTVIFRRHAEIKKKKTKKGEKN